MNQTKITMLNNGNKPIKPKVLNFNDKIVESYVIIIFSFKPNLS